MTFPNASASSADPITDPATTAPAEVTPDATPAAPSPAPQGEKPSLLDYVKDVVAKNADAAAPATTADEPDKVIPDGTPPIPGDPAPSGAPDATGGETPEDLALPFNKHPRFQALIREKNAFKEDATQFRQISDYMTSNRLTPEDVNQGFEIMSAIRNDPAKAREIIAATLKSLDVLIGETLPDDVVKLVDDGEISETAARELAKARANLALQETRHQEQAQERQTYEAEITRNAIVNAVEQWEQQTATRDPDYKAKRQLVLNGIQLAQARKPAANANEAVAYATAALAEATAYVATLMPTRKPIKAPTSAQSASHATAVPKTLGDAIKLALSR